MSLPPGVARPSHIPLQLWILERPQGPGPSDPLVLLADLAEAPGPAAAGTKAGWQQIQDSLLGAWRIFSGGTAEPGSGGAGGGRSGTWRVVRAIDLLDEAVDLTPARHVGAAGPGKTPSQTSPRRSAACASGCARRQPPSKGSNPAAAGRLAAREAVADPDRG